MLIKYLMGFKNAGNRAYGSLAVGVAVLVYILNMSVFESAVEPTNKPPMPTAQVLLSTSGDASHRSSPIYSCPMHPEMQSHVHGDNCPICGMSMVVSVADSGMAASMNDGGLSVPTSQTERSSVLVAPAMVNRLGVRSETVQVGPMLRRVSTPGFIQRLSDEGRSRYSLSADGTVNSLYVRKGDWAEVDQALFSWSSPQLIEAQTFHLRLRKKLGEDSPALKSSIERLLGFGMSEQDLSDLEQEGDVLESVTVRARREGRVLELSLREGESFSKGQLLLHMGGMVRATVLANAFQRDAAWIRSGQKAEIRLQGRGKAYPAVVAQGAVSINPNSQNIGVKLSFSAPIDEVRQAMYVAGTIFDQLHDDVLTVPLESVIWQPEGNRVIRDLGHGLFEPVVVVLGDEADGRVVVSEGLSAEDRVVSSAQFLIDSESNLHSALNRLDSHAQH